MQPPLIRPLAPDEKARFVERIVENSWHDLAEATRARRSPREIAPAVREIIAALMAQGENRILVADVEGQRNVGQAWLGEARDPYSGEWRAFLYDLTVEPGWRRRGIGRALLAAAEAAARQQGHRELALAVAAHNVAAQRLYAAHGFATERLMLTKPLGRAPDDPVTH